LQHEAFAIGQPDDLVALAQFAAIAMKDKGAEADETRLRCLFRRYPAQDRGDAQRQFLGFERLGEIIVDAGLEPEHPVLGFRLRRQHQNRHLRFFAQRPGEVDAVFARHHHVEHDQIEIEAAE